MFTKGQLVYLVRRNNSVMTLIGMLTDLNPHGLYLKGEPAHTHRG
jgi:hypothetical protein